MTQILDKTIVVRIDGLCNNNLIISAFRTDSLNIEPKSMVFEIATNLLLYKHNRVGLSCIPDLSSFCLMALY